MTYPLAQFISNEFDKKYEILKQIGNGGMSKVYLVKERNLGKLWAMKAVDLKTQNTMDESVFTLLLGEAERMKGLSHPVLPLVIDVFSVGTSMYMIMEYIPGETLEQILLQRGSLREEEAVRIILSLCDALQYLHSRKPPMIYRDMKPGNIMITPEGRVKLIDFGIAREYQKEKGEDTICIGTKGYAAPEQFGGMGQSDVRTDIYGLGVTLYHMLTGQNPAKPPYEIRPIRKIKPWLTPGLEIIVSRCTRQNPKERYSDILQVIKDLKIYQSLNKREKRRSKWKIAGFIFLVVCSICFFLTGFYQTIEAEKLKSEKYTRMVQMGKCEEAIRYMPEKTEAYIEYLKILRDNDGKITERECEKIEKILYENQEILSQSLEHGDLCFQTGITMWYWYEGTMVEQILISYPWFLMAKESGNLSLGQEKLVELHSGIGYFYKEVSPGVAKGNYKKEDITKYWRLLGQLKAYLEEENAEEFNEVIKCETYALLIYSMQNYMDQFLIAGIPKEEILSICLELEKRLPMVQINTLPDFFRPDYEKLLAREQLIEIEEGLQ